MATVWKNATIHTGKETIENGFVRFNETILEIGDMDHYHPQPSDEERELAGKHVLPGFIDVHSHGGYGIDNMDGDAEKIDWMVRQMVKQEGITSYFATTMTQSSENIEKALVAVREAAKNNPVIQGIHLEGPFISPVFKGAQPEKHIKQPDAETMKKWHDLSGGLIRLVTYAPEEGDSSEFEQYCNDNNIVLSVGHTNATRTQLRESKATHGTHLYNAQRGLHHREPGVTGHVLLEKKMYAEMIVDGFHIAPDMVKLAYQLKGPERIELITDAMRAKGMPEGESELGGQKVIVKDKQARLEAGNLAGSVLTFPDAFRNMIQFTDCSIDEAVQMSSVNQAREFGMKQKGLLQPGKDADMVCLDENLCLRMTASFGNVVTPDSIAQKG